MSASLYDDLIEQITKDGLTEAKAPACSSVRQAMLRDSTSVRHHEEVGF